MTKGIIFGELSPICRLVWDDPQFDPNLNPGFDPNLNLIRSHYHLLLSFVIVLMITTAEDDVSIS
jgi:hypothetical protein